jgi:hypothetical protein
MDVVLYAELSRVISVCSPDNIEERSSFPFNWLLPSLFRRHNKASVSHYHCSTMVMYMYFVLLICLMMKLELCSDSN